ncbi:E3 ubiquitin-protein ligase MSL2-like [Takifugu rubripes]|uniref:E3 ubiquitin-protein ligase MSL2 n=1 Tax=Takifugu rubripes TaxID=31033 RepID=H2UBB9_TAKRU|nr:E3 ubiquitin-protein ligase MSL2-like [Takifugu rubripes]|eukprot:XP_003962451.1 PREDICTED: E3 ubiquitin-protein ligase MSL2-like [Takifugu rubripes]
MNPVNATALYVSASRAVLQCDPRKPHTFSDMYTLLPFFRQSLACLVCGKLLQDPVSPTHPECEHYVCSGCKGQKMQIRTSCSRCKDYSSFQENKQLSLLVQSYRKLCLYVTHSPLLQLISSHVGGSPEILGLLEEVLMTHDEDIEADDPGLAPEEANPSLHESLTPTEAPPAPAELSAVPQSSSSDPPRSNGTQGCNGEVLEDLEPSSPELEVCELVEEQQQAGLSVSNPGCGSLELSLNTRPLAPTPGTVCSLRDGESSNRELEEGEVLLLSVEEVLQTLDPLQPGCDSHIHPDRTHTNITDRAHAQMYIQLDAAHNYTQIRTDRTNAVTSQGAHINSSSFDPAPASKRPPVRLKRKRSRSESDREKVKPLPIASILQGSSHPQTPNSTQTLHTQAPPSSLRVPAHTYSSLPNGGPAKQSRSTQNHGKNARKHVESGPKKPHSKARGGSKTKDGSKDQRLMSGCLVPPAPVRPPYKKPVEKKGCKCGRATQNPSVLTCRGQRCPCYSNRKACLDCICRGCQNSYMANGEKKLEAFAVPEKALEQTRLTLGINLTSITAAAALRNPATTSIRANTLLNVATATGTPVTTAYLSPSPPHEPNYEDSLELLIG